MKIKKEYLIIGVLILIIIALLIALTVPKLFNKYKTQYIQEGYKIGAEDVIKIILNDLQTKGFTEIKVGEQVIPLGVINGNTN